MIPGLRINADDFGWTDGHNLAVERAHREGVLHSASLMTTAPHFDEAVRICTENPDLQVGVHLVLNDTAPLSSPSTLPNLAAPGGAFHASLRALAGLWAAGRLRTGEALREWRLQLERALEAGIGVAHLDSHKHVHLFPPLLEAALALAVEYRIPALRLPLERPGLAALRRLPGWAGLALLCLRARPRFRAAGIGFAVRFTGFVHSGRMTEPRLRAALAAHRPGETTEIMVHPAAVTPQVEALRQAIPPLAGYRFEQELEALIALRRGSA